MSTVVITGGSRGIGAAAVALFAGKGHRVFFLYEKNHEAASQVAQKTGAVIAVSGVMDVVSDGRKTILLHNGCATMARITGSGCMLTTLIGGFCAAVPEHPFEATCAAMAAMGICGELAEEKRLQNKTGNATFRTDLIDAVFNLTEQELKERIRYEVYQR